MNTGPIETAEVIPSHLSKEAIEHFQKGMVNFANIVSSADASIIEQYIKESEPQLPEGAQHEEIKAALTEEQFTVAMRNINFFSTLGKLVLETRTIVLEYHEETKDKDTDNEKCIEST